MRKGLVCMRRIFVLSFVHPVILCVFMHLWLRGHNAKAYSKWGRWDCRLIQSPLKIAILCVKLFICTPSIVGVLHYSLPQEILMIFYMSCGVIFNYYCGTESCHCVELCGSFLVTLSNTSYLNETSLYFKYAVRP